jgi:hypothetical protein
VTVCRITLADGVRLELDSQRIPPDPRVLAALAEACNRILNLKGKEEDDDENP